MAARLPADPRALLLESVLKSGDRASDYEGAYDVIANERLVLLGDDRGSGLARMVSWHESSHAFLNGSTCHGNAMVFAGALASAGFPGFAALVGALLDASERTHETYATVASVSAAGRGLIDASLLDDYPLYQPLLRDFTDLFPNMTHPLLSVMALTSAARAAMQTNIYAQLLVRPVDDWPDLDRECINAPDARFAALMTAKPVGSAVSAMRALLHHASAPICELARADLRPERELELWNAADAAIFNAVSETAFDAFAAHVASPLGETGGYDAQKDDLATLIAMVETYAGARLRTRFQHPITPREDETSVLADFRREQLVLYEEKLPALIASTKIYEEDAASLFVLGDGADAYVQLAAMPLAKARALYAPLESGEPLDDAEDEVIACLRRRWAPDGEAPQIELFVLAREEAARVLAGLKADPLITCALSVLQSDNWIKRWLLSKSGPVKRLAVLIDTDPFALIDLHGDRGGVLWLTYLRAISNSETGAHTEIFCFAAADEPAVIYFTPCTPPLRQALCEYARQRFPQTLFDTDFLSPWMAMLKLLSVHVLREEGRFGDRFWL